MAKDIPEVVRPIPSSRNGPTGPVKSGGPITSSVGAGGVNESDDMRKVKTLLNGIPVERGGAFDSLDPDDDSTTTPEFSRFVEAIRIFQTQHLSRFFKADGLVEPNKRTIAKLLDEFKKKGPKPPSDKRGLLVQPAEPLKGFSGEGLKKLNGNWGLELGAPLCQMVPENGSRTLLLLTGSSGVTVGTQIDDPGIAFISGSNDKSVIITGRPLADPTKNETMLNISANGRPDRQVRIIVRRKVTVTVHFHFLGDPAQRKGVFVPTAGGGQALVDGLNKIYEPQTNVVFAKGKERNLMKVNNREIDFDRQLVVDTTDARTATPGQQLFHGKEFDSSCFDVNTKTVVNVFLVKDVAFFEKAKIGKNIIGSANDIGGRRCWVNASQFAEAGNRFVLIAHEIGHALGLTHIALGVPKFLMFPTVGANNVFIPSETLEELIVS